MRCRSFNGSSTNVESELEWKSRADLQFEVVLNEVEIVDADKTPLIMVVATGIGSGHDRKKICQVGLGVVTLIHSDAAGSTLEMEQLSPRFGQTKTTIIH